MTTWELCGQQMQLLAEAALFVKQTKTLYISDPHFGKPESFRALNIPVPHGTQAVALQRLSAALARTAAERLVILGDFWHAASSRTATVEAELLSWRGQFQELMIEVTLGNHDRAAGGPPHGWANHSTREVLHHPPFVASHFPEVHAEGYTLAGHLHPGYTVSGKGRQHLRLPAFWFGERVAVLPAFGEFTGLARLEPEPGTTVFVIAGDEVIQVT